MEAQEPVDVLIVGAGLSGIGAACQLQRRCPDRTLAIVEARESLGGTWDLFRYPGIRSDSDMFTLGYRFRPWREAKAIADGPAILAYLRETAREHGIEPRIRFGHRVLRANWSSAEAMWTVDLDAGGVAKRMRCRFLFLCAGYYRYDRGYRPRFPGEDRFAGPIVHPQFWDEGLSWEGKRVVVIGSGATAMTLVPAMAAKAAHVTMLQRSPTWVIARPTIDPLERALRHVMPRSWAHGLTRWKQILLAIFVFRLCRRRPERAKRLLLGGLRAAGVSEADIAAHFTPGYDPWRQRLCLLPDGDLFRALRSGRASIVTDRIASFDATGIALESGRHLDADLIVTATGLELQALGGIEVIVDGRRLEAADTLHYKGVMLGDVPNFATTFGYTNSSWTLKSDLVAEYVCRVLNHMRRHRLERCVPVIGDALAGARPWVDFSSGYLQRSIDLLPRQGSRPPWTLNQNYLRDLVALRWKRVDDGVLRFA